MRVLLATHPAFGRHLAGPSHPERPARIEAVIQGVKEAPVEVTEFAPPEVDRALLTSVHLSEYVDAIASICASGGGYLDPDTAVVADSWEAALRSAGSGPAAVKRLQDHDSAIAFLAVRPPGHHALEDRAMGFCVFNNIAVTTRSLRQQGARVAIIDWDVHHGNGTQEAFLADPDVLYVSLHEFPAYPGTGWLDEVGLGPAAGTCINLPFPTGTAGDAYRAAFARVVVPAVRGFSPDWLLVSAGYDAHHADPLAGLSLLESDYAAMAFSLRGLVPDGRMICFLEGGYDLQAVRGSVTATLAGMAGVPFPDEEARPVSGRRSWRMIEFVVDAQKPYWDVG